MGDPCTGWEEIIQQISTKEKLTVYELEVTTVPENLFLCYVREFAS